MGLAALLDEAAAVVRSRIGARAPRIGLVLGSGLGAFADTLQDPARIPYPEIPHFPASTAIGHSGQLVVGTTHGAAVAVMAGRAHLYEGYPAAKVVFPVQVLARLGVRVLILTNAAGSVSPDFKPGELMIIEDHISLLGTNPLMGKNDEEVGPRFFDMTEAYDRSLGRLAEEACRAAGMPVHRGVYIAVSGPSYETPAEIRMARILGAHAIGMSTVPEVIAARHMDVRVLGISCITNMAAGVIDQKLHHLEVLEVGERVKAGLIQVLGTIVREAAKDA